MQYQVKDTNQALSTFAESMGSGRTTHGDLAIALREIKDISERIESQMRRQRLELAFEKAIRNIKKKLDEGMASEDTLASESRDLFA